MTHQMVGYGSINLIRQSRFHRDSHRRNWPALHKRILGYLETFHIPRSRMLST